MPTPFGTAALRRAMSSWLLVSWSVISGAKFRNAFTTEARRTQRMRTAELAEAQVGSVQLVRKGDRLLEFLNLPGKIIDLEYDDVWTDAGKFAGLEKTIPRDSAFSA